MTTKRVEVYSDMQRCEIWDAQG